MLIVGIGILLFTIVEIEKQLRLNMKRSAMKRDGNKVVISRR